MSLRSFCISRAIFCCLVACIVLLCCWRLRLHPYGRARRESKRRERRRSSFPYSEIFSKQASPSGLLSLRMNIYDDLRQKRSVSCGLWRGVQRERGGRWRSSFFHGNRACYVFCVAMVEMFFSSFVVFFVPHLGGVIIS